jgi:glycosyltransferase involved in cell wall biosynthesis
MKIHYISGSILPSSYANAVHVMKMCAAFAAPGHDVTLFAKSGGGADDAVFAHYGVRQNFHLARSPHIRIPGLSGAVRILHFFLKANPADLHYGRDLWLMALLSNRKTPLVLELHQIPERPLQQKALRLILQSRALRGIVVITKGLSDDLRAFAPSLPPEKILIAPDGADLPESPITPEPLEPIPGTAQQTGYAGSLYPGKGLELIIEIANRAPHIGFHIFGGPRAELEKHQANTPPANIRFYGPRPHAEIPALLAACDVLLAPYLPNIHIGTGADISRWISPLKLFEYMAIKKPILCSDLPVLREVMQDRQNGLLANPANPEDWARALDLLAKDKPLAETLARRAFKELEEQYNWPTRARRILNFIAPSS